MLKVNRFVLDPRMWAGLRLKTTIFIYYIVLTRRYILYNKQNEQYYQYSNGFWQIKDPSLILDDVMAFAFSMQLNGIDGALYQNDKDMVIRMRSSYTIDKMPKSFGINYENGFFTIRDNKYVLYPHSPIWWATRKCKGFMTKKLLPEMNPQMMRFFSDLSGEAIIALNLLKLIIYYSICPGMHNLIINLCGTHQGGKSLFLKGIEMINPSGYHVGRFNNLNNFQKHDLILGATVIAFPDANPTQIQSEVIDLLKTLAGRDPVTLEKKQELQTSTVTDALVIMANNESFEDVNAFKFDLGLASRILNQPIPAIKSDAIVRSLEKIIEDGLDWLMAFGLSVHPEILEKTQRSEAINAMTGSGIEKPSLQFVTEFCSYCEGQSTLGTVLKKQFDQFMKDRYPKHKTMSLNGFYQKLDEAFAILTPVGIHRKRITAGWTYYNIILATTSTTKPTTDSLTKRFVYEGSKDTLALFSKSPFRIDGYTFQDEKGAFIAGPRLDPSYNDEAFETLQEIKDTNLKVMLGEPYKPKDPNSKHFFETGLSVGQTIHQLKKDDFGDPLPFSYQKELEYRTLPKINLLNSANFENGPNTFAYFGGARVLMGSPFFKYGVKRISTADPEVFENENGVLTNSGHFLRPNGSPQNPSLFIGGDKIINEVQFIEVAPNVTPSSEAPPKEEPPKEEASPVEPPADMTSPEPPLADGSTTESSPEILLGE